MREHLLSLYAVQKIDVGVRELEKMQEALPKKLRELEESAGVLLTEIQSLIEQREEIEKERKTLEGNAHAETHKIRKWEARLNEIRNQREYLALSREVEGGKRGIRDMEARLIELMQAQEDLDKQLNERQDRVAEEEVDGASERSEVEARQAEIETRVKSEKSRRDAIAPGLPKTLLKKYEAIRAKRFGIGIVPVIDGSCQGCNMRLPPQMYNILQRVDSIEQCPSCQRIVVWERALPSPDEASGDTTGASGANHSEAEASS